MNTENNKNLDELITSVICRDDLKFDFNRWKIEHEKEVQIYKLQTTKQKSHSAWIFRLGTIIMKNKTSKLTTAAAVILIAAVSILFLDKSITPAYGVTDLPKLFNRAKVIHIQGKQYFGSNRMPDGSEIPPVPIDNWIDLENNRFRYTTVSLSTSRDSVNVTVSEIISDDLFQMMISHTDKRAIFIKMNNYQQMFNTHKISRMIFNQIIGNVELLKSFQKTYSEKIDGVTYDIWQGEIPSGIPQIGNKLKFWLSPETGRLCKLQMLSKRNSDEWNIDFDYSDVSYDVEIPDGVFSMVVPEGYMSMNTKETASFAPGFGEGGGLNYGNAQYNLRVDAIISAKMPDDSIIVGWYSIDNKSAVPQEDFFTNLEIGGSLPALPVEIYSLKPSIQDSNTVYTGYHLANTRKNVRFTEWSLYVPDKTPPESVDYIGCNALYKFNLDPKPDWYISLNIDCSIIIENSDDFKKWILNGMSELSDNGKPPENITYEKVMELSQQIRVRVKQ
jgi:hypothetical protein